jgi:hypothetical protein
MTQGLEKRLARIEAAAGVNGRKVYVIEAKENADMDEACRKLGIEPGPDDMLVCVRHFDDDDFEPRLVNACDRA